MGKDGEGPPGQQAGPQQQAGAGAAAGGTTGGAGGGTTGGAGGGATGGGTKHKETKINPPPQTLPQHQPPVQVLQLTPELFQQTVAAAVAAALSAQRTAGPGAAAAAVAPDIPTPAPVIPRKEKKLAEFWTSRPTMWFRLFDGQFPDTMSEDARFNAILNHLPSASLPFVDHVLRAPGTTPFTRAKACLVKHYEVSPRDRARTLRSLTSLGDKTPSEMLHYMRSLLPGYPDNPLFEAIFIDLLPANARDAAVKHVLLEDMADAADKVLAEAPSTMPTSVNVICDGAPDWDTTLAQVSCPGPAPQPRRSQPKDASLCFIHSRYGKGAFKCASPKTCKMKDAISKPDASLGNANAGRQ